MKPIRVIATTACRSDFDLLTPVYHRFVNDPRFAFSLIASGSHFSKRLGYTIEHVRGSGLPIEAELETFIDDGSRSDRPRSAAQWIEKASQLIADRQPDWLLACGDREDALATCMVGAYLRVPVAHFFGGDHGDTKDVDNSVRHASSKLASLHLVMMEEHRQRLLAMGEPEDRVVVVGNPALDAFRLTAPMTRRDVLASVDAQSLGERPYAVVVHHPTFSDSVAGPREMSLILDALASCQVPALVGLPNADAGSREIVDIVESRAATGMVIPYRGLPRAPFVNLLRHAAVLVGNSSMGLLEAPSIPLPVVNVGERQRGRTAARNVLFVDAELEPITDAVKHALSGPFRASLDGLVNPYGDGHSSERVADVLAQRPAGEFIDKVHDPLRQVERAEVSCR